MLKKYSERIDKWLRYHRHCSYMEFVRESQRIWAELREEAVHDTR